MKVMLGLSGGVDSAIAAYLLKKQGYEVIACFMRNWDALANNDYLGNPTINNDQCPQEKDYYDAMEVAKKLDIPFLRIDFIKEYWDLVFSHFISEYEQGRTPNPDIFCNKYIKFDAFLKFAKKNNCDLIAMGHYVKKVNIDGKNYLSKAHDKSKDQSYFLSQLSQEQIDVSLFPLGDIDKVEVRKIAKQLNLSSVMDKKDSTGVCFIGERNFKEFLKNYLPANSGDIIDINTNRVIGKHEGVMYYTIGQHRGLGIGGISGETAIGWYVIKKDVKKNLLFVGKGSEDEHLNCDRVIVKGINLVHQTLETPMHVGVKFRYRQSDVMATIRKLSPDVIEVILDTPYKSIATGQAAVFYDKEVMIGGGTIFETYYKNKRTDC